MVHLLDVTYESYFIFTKSHKYSKQTVEQVWSLCPVLIKYVTHVVCATVKHDSNGSRFRVWFEHLAVRNVMDRTFVIDKFLFGEFTSDPSLDHISNLVIVYSCMLGILS